MAAQSDGKSAGAKPESKRGATSKPVIIDLDADAVTSSTVRPSAAGSSKADTKADAKAEAPAKAEAKKADVNTGQARGSVPPTAQSKSAAKAEAPAGEVPKTAVPKGEATGTSDPVGTVVPQRDRAASGSGGPGAFYLFAAGLIGALLALVLMFLATLAGLFSLPDGRVDDQARALAALQQRIARVEQQSAETGDLTLQPVGLGPLEERVTGLQAQIDELASAFPANSDAAPAPDVAGLLAEELTPLDARISSLEASLQSALAALESAEPGTLVAPDPALAARLDTLGEQITALEAGASQAPTELSAEFSARLNALDGLVAATGEDVAAATETITALEATIGALDERVIALDGLDAQLSTRLDTMDAAMTALAQAPVAQAPDRLARLGVALDALAAARDAGDDVGPSLQAADAAASFDGDLMEGLAPVLGGAVGGDLSQGALIASYDGAYDAMRAAIPAQGNAGLFGALEDRARQLVTIRAPQGVVLGEDASAFDQLDLMGQRIASGNYTDALALGQVLPEPVQAAGAQVIDQLSTRVVLDQAISATRQALLSQLASSTVNPSTTSP